MKKKILPYVLAFIFGALVSWLTNNLYYQLKIRPQLDALEDMKVTVNLKEAELAEVRRLSNEEIATLRGMVDSAYTIISGLEEERDALQSTADDQEAEIRELRTAEVEELLERYPALRLYDLAKDRLIETKDKIILNLTAGSAEKDKIIEAQRLQIIEEQKISESWKTQYENKNALYINLEKAFAAYRKKPGPTPFWTKALWTGVGYGLGTLGSKVF